MSAQDAARTPVRHVEPNQQLLDLLRDHYQWDGPPEPLERAVHSAMGDKDRRTSEHVELWHERPHDEVRRGLPERLQVGLRAHGQNDPHLHVGERRKTLVVEVRAAPMEGAERDVDQRFWPRDVKGQITLTSVRVDHRADETEGVIDARILGLEVPWQERDVQIAARGECRAGQDGFAEAANQARAKRHDARQTWQHRSHHLNPLAWRYL